MAQANALNLQFPVDVAHGGTGVNTLPVDQVLIGNGTSGVGSVSMTDGQVLIGATGSSPVAATLTAGGGINITSSAGEITISSSVVSQIWTQVDTSFTIAANNGYVVTAALVATLPASAVLGATFEVLNTSSTGTVTIAQNAGQSIIFGDQVTTIGVLGSLSSTTTGDSIRVVCVDATLGAEVFMVASSVGTWATA